MNGISHLKAISALRLTCFEGIETLKPIRLVVSGGVAGEAADWLTWGKKRL